MPIKHLLILVLLLLTRTGLSAQLEPRSICAWDPVGKNGPVISFFSDLIPQAINWGLDISFIPYEDENTAIADFEAGKCDMTIVTAIVSRNYVQFAGTLDAIGGITSENKLRQTLAAITSPKATDLMSTGDYEVVASIPVGSMFAFVNNRKISSIDHFINKRMAVINGDIQTQKFAELAGATPYEETLSTFSSSFNEHHVDIVLMPALAYDTFELYKGLGKTGGILDIRLFYGMLQTLARKSAFAEDFGTNMRKYMFGRLQEALILIDNAEKSIPAHYWIKTPEATKAELNNFYKDVRLALMMEDKMDPRALSLLWKIRCKVSPELAECELPK